MGGALPCKAVFDQSHRSLRNDPSVMDFAEPRASSLKLQNLRRDVSARSGNLSRVLS